MHVLVARRADFFAGRWPRGFLPLADPAGSALLASLEAKSFFAPRPQAEANPSWKQLVPYCLVCRGPEVLCVQRLRAQGESRLWGLWSIGFGGHVEPADGPPAGAVERALRRELGEELLFPPTSGRAPRLLGALNDDDTEVGRVHVGLVYRLEVKADGGPVAVRETDRMRGRFARLATLQRLHRAGRPRLAERSTLWQDPPRFESWSAILLEAAIWPQAVPARVEGTPCADQESAEESRHG